MRTLPIVAVEWCDSSFLSGWRNFKSLQPEDVEPVVCRSIGWLVEKTNEYVSITGHIGDIFGQKEKPDVDGVMSIPTGIIRKIIKIKDPFKKRVERQ